MEYAISVLERGLRNGLEWLKYYELEGYDTSEMLNELDELEYAIKVLKHNS